MGIDLEYYSHDCFIDNNSIDRDRIGVSLHESGGHHLVSNNTITNNRYGICTWFTGEGMKSWQNTIINNHIEGNDVGIDGAKDYVITNNYLNNSKNIDHILSPNRWNSTPVSGENIVQGSALGGNYWGQPDGNGFSQTAVDNDRDGFADTSFIIASQNTDYYPLSLPVIRVVPGSRNPPKALNGDGLNNDVNGNGGLDFNDVVLFFNNMDWIAANEPVSAFDFNRNGQIDFNDVVLLFNQI